MVKVLVVEDDPIIRENTIELLQFEGFDVIGASDGVEGVQKAQEYVPDIIICDILMPHLDGYGVLEQLRANPTTQAIPLVFVSASPRDDIMATGKVAGLSDFLVKPFQAPDLIRMILRLTGSNSK